MAMFNIPGQRDSGHGCYRHPLPINRIETAEGVAQYHKAFRPAFQLFIMTPATGSTAIARRLRDWLGAFERLLKFRTKHGNERVKFLGIGGWIIFIESPDQDGHGIVLFRKDKGAVRVIRGSCDDQDHRRTWFAFIFTSDIAEETVYFTFLGDWITHFCQPFRRLG